MANALKPRLPSARAFDVAMYAVEVMVVLVFAWAVWHGWMDVTSPTYRLRKDEWTCTQTDTRAFVEASRAGVSTSHASKCVQYTRDGHNEGAGQK